MEFRLTKAEEAGQAFALIQQAQAYFRAQGIPQWQNGYPTLESVRADIACGGSYVLLQDGAVVGTAALLFADEPAYAHICRGRWRMEPPYAVIHRIAVADTCKGRGLAARMLRGMEAVCAQRQVRGLRADTHRDNASMRRFLSRSGFLECGVVYLADGGARVAYEKPLTPA